jgi:pepF/M3 family oligoendopeptidase
MSTVAPSPMPRWDLTSAFPSLESPELAEAFHKIKQGIACLGLVLEEAEKLPPDVNSRLVDKFEEVMRTYDDLTREIRTLGAFISGFVSTDSRNDLALARDSELDVTLIPFSKLSTRLTAWLGTLPLDDLVAMSQVARSHRYALEKAVVSAHHLMSPEEEALAADLAPTALSGWSKLHGNVSSQIEVEVELKSGPRRMPMSMVRNLAYDPDRDVRRSAYEAELRTWREFEVPLAAAMNGIKGSINTLTLRRCWNSPLEEALFNANIDSQTLDSMLLAAREAFPDFRRYLRAKAKLLGIEKMAFYDIFAPVGDSATQWSYDEGAAFVAKQFHRFSDKLGDFAERSYRENWIDAEPRPGKRDGAFCMWLIGDESRVMMNYKTSFGSVKTLAHELGHAYHNLCLADRTMLQRRTPMTLAETASIFCETVIQNAALADADKQERLLILEGALQGSCQTAVDITSRYLFEQRVFNHREKRELSASEFSDLMIESQKETYGDGLDESQLHPYMWAVKPHYYSGRSFYNFPYMFGMLFGLGLYARYKQDPEGFKTNYDDLLSSTGLDDAATLAAKFGIDIRTPEFWRSSFDVIRQQVTDFEEAVAEAR